jgi:flagellar biosynthesis anti-sigma factor FlgM
MTQPVSFNPTRAVGEKRIAAMSKNDVQVASMAATNAPAAQPNVPLSKLTTIAKELVAAGPPYDLARIAQISQAIATGDYKIDVAAIADAMLLRMPPATR